MARALTRSGVVVMTTFVVAGLAACGGSDGDSGGEAEPVADGGLTPVTAGVLPVTDAGPIAMGLAADVWEENGLDLALETANASPTIISAVVSGDYEIGYGGVTAVFQAVENGIDLVIVAPASGTAGDPEAGINDILALPDSGFTSAADLEGQQVAVNALGGYAQLLAQVAIAAEGGDPDLVEWVELPIPDQPAALTSGAIDAFVAGEPFGTLGRDEGFITVANPHALLSDDQVVTGVWYASRAAVEEDPELYASIVAAIEESNALALSDEEGLRSTIADFTGIDPALAEEIRLSSYGELPLTAENLQAFADASLEFGVVQQPVDLDALIWNP